MREVKDAKLFLVSAGSKDFGRFLRGKGDRADYVGMGKGNKGFPCVSIPDLGSEICRGGCCQRRIFRQASLPHRAFVANEGADPVARHAIADHRIIVFVTSVICRHLRTMNFTFARCDEVVLLIVGHGGKGNMSNGPRMADAGQRHSLRSFCLL